MMLSVRCYKIKKSDRQPVYKTYRYPAFDTCVDGDNIGEKFNKAFKILKEEINEDRNHNDLNLYESIVIADAWIS